MGTISGLRELARQPRWRRWTFASFLARQPVTMTLIALVLLGGEVAGSLAVGAQLSGVALTASGLAALWRGRLLDRAELTGGLRRACLWTALALAALAVAALSGAPLPALFVLAAVQGVAMAGLSGGFRALLPVVVPARQVPRANAIEAVFVEVAFVSGPAFAGLLALLVGPIGVLGVMAVCAAVAGWIVAALPDLEPPADRPPFAPLRVEGVKPVVSLAFAMGVTVGMFESVVPARIEDMGANAELAGPLLALVAVGSAVGGFAASSWASAAIDVRRPAAALLLAFGAFLLPGALAPTILLLGAALVLVGVPIAPLNAFGTIRLSGIVPPGRQAEGFSVYIAAITLGAGAGQSVVGQLLPLFDPQTLLLVTPVIPAFAGLVVLAVVQARGARGSPRLRPSHPAP